MCSMEFYGLFLGVDTNGYFIKLQPTITEDDSQGSPDLDGNGLIEMLSYTITIDVAEPQDNFNDDFAGDTLQTSYTDNANNYRFM